MLAHSSRRSALAVQPAHLPEVELECRIVHVADEVQNREVVVQGLIGVPQHATDFAVLALILLLHHLQLAVESRARLQLLRVERRQISLVVVLG